MDIIQYPICHERSSLLVRASIHLHVHAHILVFLAKHDRLSSTEFMDSIISAEIPCKNDGMEYYNAVKEFMVHVPCGVARKKSPCMVNVRCSKHFSKKFIDPSNFDEDGYLLYKCRDDGMTMEKDGIQLDNRYMVPYNKFLLLKYTAQMNVE